MDTSPVWLARRMARNCVLNSCRCWKQKRMLRSSRKGLRSGAALGGELDVAQQGDLVPVLGDRRQVAQPVEAPLDLHQVADVLAVLLDGLRVGVDNDHAAVAVNDYRVAGVDRGGHVVEAHHRRYAQRLGDNGRVAGLTASVRREPQNVLAVEIGRLRRRQVVRQQHHVLRQPGEALVALADQIPQDPLLDVVNVLDAVGELLRHLEELFGVFPQDGGDGVLGRHRFRLDHVLDLAQQGVIFEQGEVEVEDGGCFRPQPLGRPVAKVDQLPLGGLKRLIQALDLVRHARRAHVALRNAVFLGVEHHGLAYGHAARDGYAFLDFHPCQSLSVYLPPAPWAPVPSSGDA